MFDMNYRKRNRFTPKREGSILTSFTMTIKISALIQHTSIQSSVCRVSGSWLDFMNVRNISSSAGALSKRPVTYLFGSGRRNVPVKCKSERLLVAKYSTTAPRWNKLPTTTASPPCGEKRGLLRKAVFAALGLSTTAAVCVHTSVQVTMAQGTESLRVNLESAEADWKETKDRMLSLQTDERRRFYRTRGYESLDQIPVWMPSAVPNEGGRPLYPRNKRLDGKISLHTGDITRLEVDAIVNAANKTLLGGGGVDGAIHRAAGPQLKEECATLLGCETGRAKVTGGYGLPARRVIHTVGPIVTGPLVTGPIVSEPVGGQDRAALRACYRSALEVASMPHVNARSLAFPCISTGVYGYPPDQGVHVALATVREYLDEHPDKLDRVIFCVFLPADRDLYLKSLPLYFPGAAAVVKSKL